jgi:cellulose synthase/poly-beta-1,6-N-acetylglucosamine synthase-like glycosyltransferase
VSTVGLLHAASSGPRHAHVPIAALISTKDPTEALLATVSSLITGGASKVIVVDDGSSSPQSLSVIESLKWVPGVQVVRLHTNVGKAAALQTGFAHVPRHWLIVQTDDDTLAGDLSRPARLLSGKGKADIADIRVEVIKTSSLLGAIQELDYWMINAMVKRYQNWLRARLWLSGASAMYTYAAARELLMRDALTCTEDTEGLFRARKQGFTVRYCSSHKAKFTTMVPETVPQLRKQWMRWSLGNGQVVRHYGLGGGNPRVWLVNFLSWIYLLVLPVPSVLLLGVAHSMESLGAYSVAVGIVGAIRLRRPRLAVVGILLPLVTVAWAMHAAEGLWRARKQPVATSSQRAWSPPARSSVAAALASAGKRPLLDADLAA